MKSAKYPIAEVEWFDSASVNGWMPVSDTERETNRLQIARTVGYLVREDDRTVTLAQSLSTDSEQVADITCIPLVTIISRRVLRGR